VVDRSRIEVTGVPIHPRFATAIGREEARRELGLDPDPARLTLLLMMGGFGWGRWRYGRGRAGPSGERAGDRRRRPERAAARTAGGARRGQEDRIHVHGYTDRVDLLLAASDVLVGKSGGLTSSEAMARGCR